MNWIDLVIVVIVLIYALTGWRRGFIFTLVGLVGLIISLAAALFLYQYVSQLFTPTVTRTLASNLTAFVVVFLAVDILYRVITIPILKRVPPPAVQSGVNRVFGLFLAVFQGVLLAAVLILILSAAPVGVNKETIERSAAGSRMLEIGSWLERTLVSLVPEDVLDGLTFRTIEPETGKKVVIPAVKNIRVDAEAERRMLELINRERTRRNLRPLAMDPKIRAVAREHSADMFRRGYFAHVSPEGEDAFNRMRDAGIGFIIAGENLAMAPTVKVAHEGLMESPGHRRNILNPSFREVGIGACTHPVYGTIYTQNFTN